jgi:hypothetical protein
MKLPRSESAIVEDAKVRDYPLSPEHPIGRFKARVFRAVGYDRDHWQRLRDDLLIVAATVDAELVQANQFGERWLGVGYLRSPSGRLLPVVTIWLIPSQGAPPRLITVYPATDQ